MTRRVVQANDIDYIYESDGVVSEGRRLRAIAHGRLIDELTKQPLRTSIRITTNRPGLLSKVQPEGHVGVVGVPARSFSEPSLDSNSHSFEISFEAQGYIPHSETITVGPIAGYPDSISSTDLPVALGEIQMHRTATVISGRVMTIGSSDSASPPLPAPGAQVSITSITRQTPSPDTTPVADPFVPISIHPGLFKHRDIGTHCRKIQLTPAPEPARNLVQSARQGETRLKLSSVENLSPGDILLIDANSIDRKEYLQIDSILPLGGNNTPGWVSFVHPFSCDHSNGVSVQRVVPQSFGPEDNTLGASGNTGDRCLLLNNVINGINDHDVIEISNGSHSEYHVARLFSVSTDGDGYYRLPPLSRVGLLTLHAESVTQSGDVEDFIPDYNRTNNLIDVVISQP